MLGYGMVLCTTADADRVIKSGCILYLYTVLVTIPAAVAKINLFKHTHIHCNITAQLSPYFQAAVVRFLLKVAMI